MLYRDKSFCLRPRVTGCTFGLAGSLIVMRFFGTFLARKSILQAYFVYIIEPLPWYFNYGKGFLLYKLAL